MAECDVRAAARADRWQLRLVVELLRPELVRPYAGGVDDVRGAHVEVARRSRRRERARRMRGRPASSSAVTSRRFAHTGPEALRLPEHRQHEPHVVRLAVVEQVSARRLPAAERGSSSTTSSPLIMRWRAGLQDSRPRRRSGPARRPPARDPRAAPWERPRRERRERRRSRSTAITSYRLSPTPTIRSGCAPSNAATTSGSGWTRWGASATISLRSSSASRTSPRSKFCR